MDQFFSAACYLSSKPLLFTNEKLRPSDGWLVLLSACFLCCHVIAIGDRVGETMKRDDGLIVMRALFKFLFCQLPKGERKLMEIIYFKVSGLKRTFFQLKTLLIILFSIDKSVVRDVMLNSWWSQLDKTSQCFTELLNLFRNILQS